MSSRLQRDIFLGAIAGLLGGLVLAVAGVVSGVNGLLGLALSGPTLVIHLLVSVPAGALFCSLFRYQPGGYAALISNGLLYALVLWVAGPLTLGPLLDGQGPTWSVLAARGAFGSLIGHLLFGGVTSLSFYAFATVLIRLRPEQPARPSEEPVSRIVILGGGFGGISSAQRLEQLFWRQRNLEVSLVSQSNYLLFTPMLAEVAASALEPQHISAPVRATLPHTRFHRADVDAIDTNAQIVHIRNSSSSPPQALPYDHLVLALGSVPNYFGLPGMEANAFTLKSLHDATLLRNHVIAQLEKADVNQDVEERRRQLTFVVAGGGFAGTEVIAELFDLVHSVLRYYPDIHHEEPRFVLVHSRDRILPELGEKLADYALRKLRARGIEFLLNTRVAGATPEGVLVGDGEVIGARTVVWTAGNQAPPILKELPCERNRAGAVMAEATLQVKGLTNVWVAGDCGQIPDLDREGQAFPPTAQHAIREGKAAASNIAAVMRGKPPKALRFRTLGILVPLGHHTGVAEIRGLRFSGLLAWLIWRAIYLSLLPGLEKKVRVLFDWTIDLFFPRDIVLTADTESATIGQIVHVESDSDD